MIAYPPVIRSYLLPIRKLDYVTFANARGVSHGWLLSMRMTVNQHSRCRAFTLMPLLPSL